MKLDCSNKSDFRVAASIVLYNEKRHIPRLVNSLLKQRHVINDVYVYDNQSTDGCADLTIEMLPTILLERSNENGGFAKGHNVNAKKAFENGSDLLLILNTDVEFDEAFVAVLLTQAKKHATVGVFCPMIIDGTSPIENLKLQAFRTYFSLSGFTKRYPDWGLQARYWDQLPEVVDVTFPVGAGFMIQKWCYQTVGLWNEEGFMYGEEIDFAYRLRKNQIKVKAVRDARLIHLHDWSNQRSDKYAFEYYYINRNRILFFKRHGLYQWLIWFLLGQLAVAPIKIRWLMKKGGRSFAKYYYLGIYRGLLGETGHSKIF